MRAIFDLSTTPLENGMTAIEASAGTGKTYCLAALVVRLLVERETVGIGNILVVTFTRAAAEELSTRIRDGLRRARDLLASEELSPDAEDFLRPLHQRFGAEGARRLRDALLAFDELTVATIHGFCKQMLEINAFESGLPFDLELLEDDEKTLATAAADVWRRLLYPETSGPLSALVVARELGPGSFVPDFLELKRHPGARLMPSPEPLDQALAAFSESHRQLALFDQAGLRLILTRLRFRQPRDWSPHAIRSLVESAASFAGGDLALLGTVERLRRAELLSALERGQDRQLDGIEFLDRLERVFERVDRLEHALRGHFLTALDERLEQLKRKESALSFDDLLRRLQAALADGIRGRALKAAIRQRFHVALIDEFQDTDQVQFEIFKALFAGRPLFLIGDPKQAIYRFRGADVFAYLRARREADRVFTLDRNWRSAPALVAAINQLFSASPRPFWLEEIEPIPLRPAERSESSRLVDSRQPEAEPAAALQWWWAQPEANADRAETAIVATVAREIAEALDGGLEIVEGDRRRPVEAGDFAVLTRTHAEAQHVQRALRAAAIPSVVSRSGDIFSSAELEELERLLRAIATPGHATFLRSAVVTVLWGLDALGLQALADDEGAWQEQVEELDGYLQSWRRHGFLPMIQGLISEKRLRERLLRLDDGERRVTNLLHAVELLQQAALEGHLSPQGLLAWVADQRRRSYHNREASELRLESDARAVKIVTVHKSKGLEYNIVFCPFLWRSRPAHTPYLVHAGKNTVLDFGSEDVESHAAMAEGERLAEDLRLAYVALTRARHRVYAVWGELGRYAQASPLAYLLHQKQKTVGLGIVPRVDATLAEIDGRRALWRADLDELVRRSGGAMSVRTIDVEAASSPARNQVEIGELRVRKLPAWLDRRLQAWQIASFTRLARRSFDAAPSADRPDHEDPAWPVQPARRKPQGLFALARGRRTGDCLHRILEEWTFQAPSEDSTIASKVKAALLDFGLAASAAHLGDEDFEPRTAILDLLETLSRCGLPGCAQTFSEVDPARRLVEWSFHLELGRFSAPALRDLFRHFADELPPSYPERLGELGRESISGFLTGFVDLIFESDGRYFLVDWKSNHLGNFPGDYHREALELAMVEHHYPLQFLVYTVALHRFLAQRQAGYDYDRHFGGICYVFLRGLELEPATSLFEPRRPRFGVFDTRPSRRLIEAFDAWLEGR